MKEKTISDVILNLLNGTAFGVGFGMGLHLFARVIGFQ